VLGLGRWYFGHGSRGCLDFPCVLARLCTIGLTAFKGRPYNKYPLNLGRYRSSCNSGHGQSRGGDFHRQAHSQSGGTMNG